MNRVLFLTAVIFCAFLWQCSSNKSISTRQQKGEFLEEIILDTLLIDESIMRRSKIYQPTAQLNFDIIHTSLDLSFDWQKSHVHGVAELTIKPYFQPIDHLELDAVGFTIKKVVLKDGKDTLQYAYNGKKLAINLDRKYERHNQFILEIHYVAKPDENPIGGSAAITSDKGLFFIDPLGVDPDLPTQIWTQGETENNSKWFPTFDKPNERFTQEIKLTVDDKYQTLSNGKLIASKKNQDGTRTDHWKQDKPHAVYLAMIAVGEFDETSDEWNGIPLHYYVDKGFGKYSKKIFNHTPEMLTFFSEKLKVQYPWDKYSQIIVRNFVSGAMENTGAVVFGEFVQKTDRELIDDDNDAIVAHEMMHHWFGNLVTCEDWSNLTLNEGFANYAEYLWMEHKYGKNRAEWHRMNEMNGYYNQLMHVGARPIIDYYYSDKENMFDAHSYNKGGLVLHMLRNYLGEDAFFESLYYYLTKHQNSPVEIDELRMAFEDISGIDLKWFFKQWFLEQGHPHISVSYVVDADNQQLKVYTDLSQTPNNYYQNFIIPSNIALYYADGTRSAHPIVIDAVKDTFNIPLVSKLPETYVFDGDNVLLAMVEEQKTADQYRAQFRYSPNLFDKIVAFTNLEDQNLDLIDLALNDDFWYIRTLGIQALSAEWLHLYEKKLEQLVVNDAHSSVRMEALSKLLELETYNPVLISKVVLNKELAYPIIQMALEILYQYEETASIDIAKKYINDESDYLASTLLYFFDDNDPMLQAYANKKARTIKVDYLFDYFESYLGFLVRSTIKTQSEGVDLLFDLGKNSGGNMFRKYVATISLAQLANHLIESNSNNLEFQNLRNKIENYIREIVAQEEDPILKEKYKGLE